ncbi:hypothetical protein [Actinoplanes sp. NPDC051851]|uniref:phage tail protein n=1 Tax=Actinoplanes sp. NPDC051851 TaxID=3154753 RepID=UPI0034418932
MAGVPAKVAAVRVPSPATVPAPVVVTAPAAAVTGGSARGAPSPSPGEPLARVLQAQMLMGNAAVAASLLGAPRDGIPPGGVASPIVPASSLAAPPAPAVPVLRPAVPPPATPAAAASAKPVVADATKDALAKAADPAALAVTGPEKTKAAGAPPAESGGAPTARPGAAQTPKFTALRQDVHAKKRKIAASHPPARTESGSAQSAAVPPGDDREAQGKVANADRMNDAKPKSFDKKAFVDAVKKAIADQAPKNLEEADEYADSGKPEQVKQNVQGHVDQGREESGEEIESTTGAPPDTSHAVEKKVVPMAPDRPPGAPAAPDAAAATPDRLPPSATDLSAGPRQVDREMADAQITETQLQKSNEPAFQGAVKAKKGMEEDSARAPGEMRARESKELAATRTEAGAAGATGMAGLAAARAATGAAVGAGKQGAKGADETKRAQVTAALQAVFDATKKDVEDILKGLDKTVDEQFTREEKRARDAFKREHTVAMARYKADRYGDWNGGFLWAKDKLLGLPDEANRIIDVARQHYVDRMELVISDVADTIGRELDRAKARIVQGREQLQDLVRRLPADLRSIGQEAAAEFTDRFDELTAGVDEKSTEMVQTLATKYNEALKSVDDEVAAAKEANKGLVQKAVDAVKGVIKTIKELMNLLLNVLAKASSAISLIIKDPIGFLKNLVAAVGAGLNLFRKNIVRHLQQGMLSWLLGVSSQAGLQLPKTFDAKGVLLLIAGLLGLTWSFIRSRIVRKIPEKAVAAVETAIPLIQKIRKQGIAGIWDEIKAQIGDLKKTLVDKIIEYLVPTIIVAGVTWVLSLLNPASAFIRACKLIIDIVKFVVERARQILDFVNAVLDAVIAIAKGGTGGVPAMIENALARALPLLIGFLAALLGIGGIAAKVKQIFQALSKPVAKALDWIIGKIVTLAKKLWTKLKARLKKARDKLKKAADKVKGTARNVRDRLRGGDDSPAGKRNRLAKGLAAAVAVAKRLKGKGRVTHAILRAAFTVIRVRYGMTTLDPVLEGNRWVAVGVVNPLDKRDLNLAADENPVHGPLTEKDAANVEKIAAELPKMGDRFAEEFREHWNNALKKRAIEGHLIWPDEPVPSLRLPGRSRAFLSENRTHRMLLPYFERTRTGAAFSDNFYLWAFSRPVIRAPLVEALGADALGQIQRPHPGRDAELQKELENVTFSSSGRWGTFEALPTDRSEVDPDLVAAVEKAENNIVKFFKMVVKENVRPWNEKIFVVWKHGPSHDFMENRFRRASRGKHEWIPTNFIPEVLRRGLDRQKNGDVLDGVRWVALHHELRSDSHRVIWKLEGVTPHGHSGALWEEYVDKKGKNAYKFTLTNGQDKFHDELRDEFTNWGSGAAPDYVQHLLGELPRLMWDGVLAEDHGPFLDMNIAALVKTDTGLATMTVRRLGIQQEANFKQIRKDFRDAKEAVMNEKV